MASITIANEYIAPSSNLAYMFNIWHGWWRFLWFWRRRDVPNVPLFHLSYGWRCQPDCPRIWISLTCPRVVVMFGCRTKSQIQADYRRMFAEDISVAEVVYEDVLDAEVIG